MITIKMEVVSTTRVAGMATSEVVNQTTVMVKSKEATKVKKLCIVASMAEQEGVKEPLIIRSTLVFVWLATCTFYC